MGTMRKVRTTASDPDELVVQAEERDRSAPEGTDWQQQQLLPGTAQAPSRSDRPSDRLRKAGLVGIAQAREALAEAARRAQARSGPKAA
jgi:hypothetical protein